MSDWQAGSVAQDTNDSFAPAYDDFNYQYRNTQWTGRLLARVKTKAGEFSERRLLDVGCGTGLSTIPMFRRGWHVTACDISGRMIEIAAGKVGDRVAFHQADVRELPRYGEFDLVWAINDTLNYLLHEEELRAAILAMKRNLATDGVLLFDLNTLFTFRTFFSRDIQVEVKGRRLLWTGCMTRDRVEIGGVFNARFEEIGDPDSMHVHYQRHFPQEAVLAMIEEAGLKCIDQFGVSEPDGNFSEPLDEDRHTKAVYVCQTS